MAKVFQEQKTYIDKETGEMISLENTIVKTVKSEDFMQIYLTDLSGLFSLESVAEYKILICLWKRVSFNNEHSDSGNKIILVKSVKEEIAKEIGISYSRLVNCLPILVSKDIVMRLDRSTYMLNPNYFFKGYTKDRYKVIKASIEYRFE